MWHALTGFPPFVGTLMVVMYAHVWKEPDWSKLEGVGEEVIDLLRLMLAKRPEERPADATALMEVWDRTINAAKAAGRGDARAKYATATASTPSTVEPAHDAPPQQDAGNGPAPFDSSTGAGTQARDPDTIPNAKHPAQNDKALLEPDVIEIDLAEKSEGESELWLEPVHDTPAARGKNRSILSPLIWVASILIFLACGLWFTRDMWMKKIDDPQKNNRAPKPGQTFANTLGMEFVPVPGTGVWMCVHETRKGDYRKYAMANPGTDSSWENVVSEGKVVSETDDHPVVMVSDEESEAFCKWLSKTEGKKYRLPTDREWSMAVGIGPQEDPDSTPGALSGAVEGYPWGTKFPPTGRAGNFADEVSKAAGTTSFGYIFGYNDGHATTAPVKSYEPNNLGIYDLGGNVWEWCGSWRNERQAQRVLRGGSWINDSESRLRSSCRIQGRSVDRVNYFGFRCVVEMPVKN